MTDINYDTNTWVPQWKLRRLAPRALHIMEAHKGDSAPLATFAASLPPVANRFVKLYDETHNNGTTATTQETAGTKAIDNLVGLIRSWLGPMSRDIPALDASSFTERVNAPEDAVASAKRLVALAKKVGTEGTPLPYEAQLDKSVGDAIDAAVKESEHAQEALRGSQDLQAQTRDAATALQSELVAFRRALRGAIGTSHRDYLALRTERVQQTDPVDGTVPATPVAGNAGDNKSAKDNPQQNEAAAAQ